MELLRHSTYELRGSSCIALLFGARGGRRREPRLHRIDAADRWRLGPELVVERRESFSVASCAEGNSRKHHAAESREVDSVSTHRRQMNIHQLTHLQRATRCCEQSARRLTGKA